MLYLPLNYAYLDSLHILIRPLISIIILIGSIFIVLRLPHDISRFLNKNRIDRGYRFRLLYPPQDGGDDANRRRLIDKLRGQH